MDRYVTGSMIKQLREQRGMTQAELAAKLCVSDKAVSKWETARGYPDITLIAPLADALGVSVAELLSGAGVTNSNRAANMLRMRLYVCPVCGNVLCAAGEAVISCCGITLPPLEPETPDVEHEPTVEIVEDEYYITVPHEMTKEHFISFIIAVRDNGCELIKLYPEGSAEARVGISRTRQICYFCNHHGLFKVSTVRRRRPQA